MKESYRDVNRMSWSSDIEIAKTFARGLRGRPQGKLWSLTIDPRAIFAQINDRDESEYVIDPNCTDLAVEVIP